MGKEEEAFEKFQAVLRESPRCAEAHGALAEHYQERGEAKQAAESRRRAEFYDWMPGFAALEYSSERYSSFRLLSESPEADETEEADEAKLEEKARAIEKRRAAEVERLIGDGSPASLSMLAAFCFHHDHHGEIENHAYQGLVSKDKALAIQLLEGLLREGQNLCTMRSAAFALAELKAPVTFELVSNALPQDVRPYFYMDAAGALAVLGDPRAVGPLVKVLNPAHHLAEPKDDRMQTTLGRNWARWRAALALGSFDTGESRQALEEGTANDQIALACRAALYRLTREEKHLAPVAKALKSTTGLAESIVGRYLAEMDDPRAKALAEEHAKLEEEEQARRRREEKN